MAAEQDDGRDSEPLAGTSDSRDLRDEARCPQLSLFPEPEDTDRPPSAPPPCRRGRLPRRGFVVGHGRQRRRRRRAEDRDLDADGTVSVIRGRGTSVGRAVHLAAERSSRRRRHFRRSRSLETTFRASRARRAGASLSRAHRSRPVAPAAPADGGGAGRGRGRDERGETAAKWSARARAAAGSWRRGCRPRRTAARARGAGGAAGVTASAAGAPGAARRSRIGSRRPRRFATSFARGRRSSFRSRRTRSGRRGLAARATSRSPGATSCTSRRSITSASRSGSSSDKERARLRESIEGMKPPSGGLIVRTVAEGLTKKQLKADVGYLVRLWGEIAKKREGAHAPQELWSELDVVLKTARDLSVHSTKSTRWSSTIRRSTSASAASWRCSPPSG